MEPHRSAVGTTIDKPRTARLHCHRANAGAVDQSCSDYYRINVYFPFIDHIVKELETRFSSDHDGLVAVQYLVPTFFPQLSQDKIDSLESYNYEEKENLATEITKWRKCYERMTIQKRPKSAISAFADCSPQTFPTLHKIFTISLTTPVGSVSCERSFSALRRLKLWTRSL